MNELLPYQLDGAAWLSKKKYALLADEMRLGKTVQTITAADMIGAQRILVVCPGVARLNWLREFDEWSIFDRPTTAMLSGKTKPGSGVTSVSYELAAHALQSGTYDLLVIDEAHFIKSIDAARTVTVLGKNGLVRQAKRTWCLTGTPAPNHIGEMWVMLFVFGVYTKSYEDFIKDFCTGYHSPYGYQITGHKNIDRFKQLIAPFCLRRSMEQVMPQLPKIKFGTVTVEPTPLSEFDMEIYFTKYLAHPRRFVALKEDVDAQYAMVENVLTTVHQFADDSEKQTIPPLINALEAMGDSTSTMRRYVGMLKVPKVAELVAHELDNGLDKIVIFAVHQAVIEELRSRLKKYGAVTLYGKTDPHRRELNVRKFQRDPKTRVFIGNIRAAGTAIDLSSACDVLFVEADWVPGPNAQAAMRVHNIRQTRPVTARFVSLVGTIDEKVQDVLRRKTLQLAAVFD